ncbi:MAG: hypothetical protein BM485_04150 [Desulfobulbaceae bacterium DB1]|nr:MAG: hypothetical protein BM485_04150 [Desulfobulbaceae bacterium DB1]
MMRFACFVLPLLVLLGAAAVHAEKNNEKTVSSMSENGTNAIPPEKQIIVDALGLARSMRAEDHAELLARLTSPDFLAELDDETAYSGRPERLRLRRIMDELTRNPLAGARQVLVALTTSRVFMAEDARIDLLIAASSVIKPPPPEVVRFWDAHWQPDDGFSNLTVAAVVKNGDEAAVALLEKKMANPDFDMEEKLHWLHGPLLSHRLDLPLLQSCERMLLTGLPADLEVKLVETLFDYRPREWYLPSIPYNPPLLETAGEAVLLQVQKIGVMARERFALDARLEARVKMTLEQVQKLLEAR